MPNFYTHLCFARAVSARVSPELRPRLLREWDSFSLGNFGPDPLYFGSSKLRSAGLRLHHGTGAAALEVYRKAVAIDKPYARSFAAGYFLHHFLDSRMHPLIYRIMEETGLTHRCLEGEMDRLLMEQDSVSAHEIFPCQPMPEQFYMTAARMVPGLSPEDYRKSLKNFRRISMVLVRSGGTPLRHGANLASRLPGMHGLKGAILAKTPPPDMEQHLREMVGVFTQAVHDAPHALEQFLADAIGGRDFDPALFCDFSGKRDV